MLDFQVRSEQLGKRAEHIAFEQDLPVDARGIAEVEALCWRCTDYLGCWPSGPHATARVEPSKAPILPE